MLNTDSWVEDTHILVKLREYCPNTAIITKYSEEIVQNWLIRTEGWCKSVFRFKADTKQSFASAKVICKRPDTAGNSEHQN